MSIELSTDICNPTSTNQLENVTPEQVAQELERLSIGLREIVVNAAKEGSSFDSTERRVWDMVRKTGFQALELFIKLQGQGDLGDQVTSESISLGRSSEPAITMVRSIFGQHAFAQYTYSSGKNKKIALRPISARMQLPENRWSYLLQEFSQMFCVDQAFNQAADNLETVLGAKFAVDTLEQTSQRMGVEADAFLDELPTPKKKDEGAFLVGSADCKGVPLIKENTAKVAAFETAKKRPGNRRMATVTSAYTVDPHVRTAEQIVAALFRDEKEPEAAQKATAATEEQTHLSPLSHDFSGWRCGDSHQRYSRRDGVACRTGQFTSHATTDVDFAYGWSGEPVGHRRVALQQR